MADRFITIEAPGFDKTKDELVVLTFQGHEGVSRLFNFQLDMLSKDFDIKPEKFIGLQVDVSIQRAGGAPRFFNGFISRFSAGGMIPGNKFRVYHAEIVPWLWFLTQTSDCRVFNKPPEDKLKVLSIIEEVLGECSHNKFSTKDMGAGKDFETEYCVQYRETDFNFVSRLMEQFGMYYYFVHKKGSHEMVLSDAVGGYGECLEKKVEFAGTHGAHTTDHVTYWEHDYEFVPGKFTHTDYDFKKPSTDLRSSSGSSSAKLTGHADYELFDFPGEFDTTGDGKKLADARIQETETGHNVVRGGSSCRTFTAGHKFTLEKHSSSGEDGAYLLTSVQHMARQTGPVAGTGTSEHYANTYSCLPAASLFRPTQTTRKPVVPGLQTALVVGKPGDEIYCDKYGRVRVRFPWEREGVGKARHEDNKAKTADDKCTCWIRVASQVAGNKWGWVGIPRIGQEVVINFLEGDPDRPLIVGSVYNEEQMPHYDLPANNAKTYIKTNSTKGGEGFNELMFDDKKDHERLYMHAEKDMDVVVKNDSREHIWADRHRILGGPKGKGNLTELLHGSKEITVKKQQLELIEGSYALKVGGGEETPGVMDVWIEKQEKKKIGQDGKHLIVEGDCNNQIGGGLSVSVTGAHQETCGGYALDAGTSDVHIKGMNVVVEGTTQLTIKVGGSFVAISSAGVDITGPMVNINSGGSAGSGAGASPTEPEEAPEALPNEPDEAWSSKTGHKSARN